MSIRVATLMCLFFGQFKQNFIKTMLFHQPEYCTTVWILTDVLQEIQKKITGDIFLKMCMKGATVFQFVCRHF